MVQKTTGAQKLPLIGESIRLRLCGAVLASLEVEAREEVARAICLYIIFIRLQFLKSHAKE